MASGILALITSILVMTSPDSTDQFGDGRNFIFIASGILAIAFSLGLVIRRNSFIQAVGGCLLALEGVLMIATAATGSSGSLLTVVCLLAAIVIIIDIASYWVNTVYWPMYVNAALGVVALVLFIAGAIKLGGNHDMHIILIFGIWLVFSGFIFGFLPETETAKDVSEKAKPAPAAPSKKKEQAHNKKGKQTPKTKRKDPSKPQATDGKKSPGAASVKPEQKGSKTEGKNDKPTET